MVPFAGRVILVVVTAPQTGGRSLFAGDFFLSASSFLLQEKVFYP
jgi:hypothetical protein